jgi:hypothetical protein
MLGGRPTPLPVAERFERGFMRIGYAPQAPSDRASWQPVAGSEPLLPVSLCACDSTR